MILFNKTMMCGGLVVLAPGSPVQVLFAILIMQFHLLFLLKLAPYEKDSEDWSSFFATLGLCLISLAALMMMLDLEGTEQYIIGLVTTVLPCLCIAVVLGIMIMYDFGLKQRLCGTKISSTPTSTQIQPVDPNSSDTVPETQVVPAPPPPPQIKNQTEITNEAAIEYSEETDSEPTNSSQRMTRVRSARSQIVHNIHEEHRLSQAGLQQSIDIRQRKQRRQTQIRLNARTKLKKQKTLSNIPAFAVLTEKEIETMIDNMTHEKHLIGTTLCTKNK